MNEVHGHFQQGSTVKPDDPTPLQRVVILSPFQIERIFEGSLEQLSNIRNFVGETAHTLGGNEDDCFACELACDEAAANVFNHAFDTQHGRLKMVIWRADNRLVMRLHYFGKSFDPSRIPEPDLKAPLEERPTGGLGLYFMRQLMDEVHFEFDETSGNTLTMRRILNIPERYGVMELSVEHPTDHTAVVHVQGSVDGSNFKQLISQADALHGQGVQHIILEVSGCEYMSSSGLVALNAIAKLLRGEAPPDTENGWAVLKTLDDARSPLSQTQLVLVNPTARVDRVLDLAGLKNLIPIYPDIASALAAVA
jgi:anti-sigma regulatory factor (Ser/Thr protein kinase)/anti-anti-sigma regulatory factor